jgi:hypothetical protein
MDCAQQEASVAVVAQGVRKDLVASVVIHEIGDVLQQNILCLEADSSIANLQRLVSSWVMSVSLEPAIREGLASDARYDEQAGEAKGGPVFPGGGIHISLHIRIWKLMNQKISEVGFDLCKHGHSPAMLLQDRRHYSDSCEKFTHKLVGEKLQKQLCPCWCACSWCAGRRLVARGLKG